MKVPFSFPNPNPVPFTSWRGHRRLTWGNPMSSLTLVPGRESHKCVILFIWLFTYYVTVNHYYLIFCINWGSEVYSRSAQSKNCVSCIFYINELFQLFFSRKCYIIPVNSPFSFLFSFLYFSLFLYPRIFRSGLYLLFLWVFPYFCGCRYPGLEIPIL